MGTPRGRRVKMATTGTTEQLYDQLIFELYVRDLDASVHFFEQFGFGIHRRQGNFVELVWGPARIFLEP